MGGLTILTINHETYRGGFISMKLRLSLIGFFSLAVLTLGLIFAGFSFAQHEGGLGEKKVPLNIATEEQLMKIEGMTPALAKAIVEYRTTKGFFKKPEDLLKVPGMTQDIYDTLKVRQGVEGDIFCVPKEGSEEEDEEPTLSPSKC
jgi:competence ComEA-like helix-hairpin-helix protein